MENKLLNLTSDKELRITSVELVGIINDFRILESKSTGKEYVSIQHNTFMRKIRNEIETLDLLSLEGQKNFVQSSYINSQNKEQPCYSLNKDGMLQMLNSESVLVRYKTIEYINELEDENIKLKEGQLLISAKEEIKELKSTLDDFKKATEEAKQMYKPSHKRKLQYDKLIKSVTSDKEEYDMVKEWIFAVLEIEKWEDTSIEQNKKILEIISTVSRMLNVKKFEQLSLF
ncbi:hypothetical protein FDB28_10270 [Clostridium botulinum]|uniref:Rha family transcriptional regulator n=2 Tax=Clostridium TaxID=1485 RepID=UPI0013FCC9C1|nr:Rha family transcriptional regulator [Clostridium sp. ZBS20]MBN1046182.1 hypothetical protein [Clostridium botulinum]MBN1052205.1 hypothetical protein [Clostridium botulinum]NFN94465.1 hypothetical protein [Clostridium botulinum]NFS96530.1 hypothetical protein [Clostridium botulinum]NFT07645.1 hypothetical protein [Clostridium botulinum]